MKRNDPDCLSEHKIKKTEVTPKSDKGPPNI